MLDNSSLIYRDEDLVAILKPSGISVHRGWDQDGPFALQQVRDLIGRHVFPVHRLDRPTSGVLVFGLSSEAAHAIQRQFQEGKVEKRYLALVRGIPQKQGTVDHPVPRSRDNKERVDAVTDYRVLSTFERFALVEALPRTGRLHQIRRHMKHLSCHIIGDVKYGKGEHNRRFRQDFGLRRLALHALRLSLNHPVSGKGLRLFAPVPEDLAGPLRLMGLDSSLWNQDQWSRDPWNPDQRSRG